MEYKHLEIEKKWQQYWEDNQLFKTDINTTKPKYYVLDMFPYPSGAGLHVGHPEGYTATDIVARMKKMQGFEVLHPMGWDAFGLPAEQYAIQTGNSPEEFTKKNIQIFKKQLKALGFSFDWTREISTTDPKYFKNTQWIFAQIYKKGLVELKNLEVNWSPSLNTVLANEEVIIDEKGNPVSERDGLLVEKKVMKQWVLKITEYARKLFDGLEDLDWPESVKKLQKNWIYNKNDQGEYTDDLHLNDWLFARQRYWGEPFPIIHLENGEIYLIPEIEYPVELPIIADYKFSQDGKPALINAGKWINVEVNGIKGQRDLNTMPQWAGSCWYYMGYVLKDGDDFLSLDSPAAKKRLNKWLPVDLYVGGQEHAVLHLMYARFWHMVLYELGITNVKEPFQKLFNQGMILGSNGNKMSKSKGNVVNPDDIVKQFGADSLRLYEMFMGSLEDDKPWTEKGIKSSRDWLDRVYRIFNKVEFDEPSNDLKLAYNHLITKVTNYYETLKFNMAISEMMIFINHLYKEPIISNDLTKGFLQLLSCVAPHIADEIFSSLDISQKTLIELPWPKIVEAKELKEDLEIVIQINGKVRAKVMNPSLSKNPSEADLIKFVIQEVPHWINSPKQIKKIFFVQGKLINVVL